MRFTGGLPETACGKGSTLAETKHLRSLLFVELYRLGGGTLLDVPCGDCNWISRVALPGIEYIGADNSPEHLSRAAENLGVGRHNLLFVDLLTVYDEQMPKADIVLCRDFLQHVPDALLSMVFRNLLATGAKWFLITSFKGKGHVDVKLGGFRPLNLTEAPVGLPIPDREIEDPPGSERIIGIWPRSALESP